MKSSRLLWRITGIAGLVTTLILLFGFVYAVSDILNPSAAAPDNAQTQPAEKEPTLSDKNEIGIVAVGDSLTKGTGDATGDGYVRQVVKQLGKKLNKPVKLLNNLGINGMRADTLAKKLEERGYVYSLSQADVILLTIGGNDLFQTATGSMNLTAGSIDPQKLQALLTETTPRLEKVLVRLHEINPNARIIYIGMYNPFYDLDETRETNKTIREWNDKAFDVINRYPNMTLVPTIDLFQKTLKGYISSDHFHPNALGYEKIAERVVQVLE